MPKIELKTQIWKTTKWQEQYLKNIWASNILIMLLSIFNIMIANEWWQRILPITTGTISTIQLLTAEKSFQKWQKEEQNETNKTTQ